MPAQGQCTAGFGIASPARDRRTIRTWQARCRRSTPRARGGVRRTARALRARGARDARRAPRARRAGDRRGARARAAPAGPRRSGAVAPPRAQRHGRHPPHEPRARAARGGRARARQAVAAGYSNLELDLTGGRGSARTRRRAGLRATGAEAAICVNNGAAALVLALAALAGGREIVVSRGQLVEIGDGFRIPEIVQSAGARLREVGTTNRTHLADYTRASAPKRARCCASTPPTTASSASRARSSCGNWRARARRLAPARLRRRLGRAARDRGAGRGAARGAARRRRPRLVLGRQAPRRPPGRHPRRQRGRDRRLPPASPRPRAAHRQARWRRSRRRCASTATHSGRAPRCLCCARCSSPPRTCALAPTRSGLASGGPWSRSRARRRRCAAAGGAAVVRRPASPAMPTCSPRACVKAIRQCSRASPTAGSCSIAGRSATPTRNASARPDDRAAHAHARHRGSHRPRQDRLVNALTGVDCDRLPEEKARGITIDLGFAHLAAVGPSSSVVDVPGHERFVAQ